MKQTQLTETISYIEPTAIHSNISSSALVISSAPGIVVDLNLSAVDTERVLKRTNPERAYATHFHYDHSQFWKAVEQWCDADFFLPEGEMGMMTDAEAFLAATFGEYGNEVIRRGFLDMADYRPITGCRAFNGSHRIRSGTTTIEAVPSPGHSPDHMSFYLPGERIMFTGDLGIGNRFGPWYGWMSCDISSYVESLLRLKSYHADVLLTSHEGMIHEGIDCSLDNCLNHFLTREASIRKKLDAGYSEADIVAEGIYFTNKERVKEPMKTIITIWDRIMLDHHLAALAQGALEKLFPEVTVQS